MLDDSFPSLTIGYFLFVTQKRRTEDPVAKTVHGTTNTVYGTTNADAGVGIGSKRGIGLKGGKGN